MFPLVVSSLVLLPRPGSPMVFSLLCLVGLPQPENLGSHHACKRHASLVGATDETYKNFHAPSQNIVTF